MNWPFFLRQSKYHRKGPNPKSHIFFYARRQTPVWIQDAKEFLKIHSHSNYFGPTAPVQSVLLELGSIVVVHTLPPPAGRVPSFDPRGFTRHPSLRPQRAGPRVRGVCPDQTRSKNFSWHRQQASFGPAMNSGSVLAAIEHVFL